ncbi:hypothetical protein V6N13_083225 [Hibiscus sabdariffa]
MLCSGSLVVFPVMMECLGSSVPEESQKETRKVKENVEIDVDVRETLACESDSGVVMPDETEESHDAPEMGTEMGTDT